MPRAPLTVRKIETHRNNNKGVYEVAGQAKQNFDNPVVSVDNTSPWYNDKGNGKPTGTGKISATPSTQKKKKSGNY